MKGILLLLFFVSVPYAQSHNVDVETRSEDGELVIQVWLGDDPGEEVEIEIFDPKGELRYSGQTDSEGILRWQPIREEALTISVYAEPGHSAELELEPENIKEILAGSHVEKVETEHQFEHKEDVKQSMPSTMKNRQPIVNAIAGLGLILSLAAVWMAYRNQKQIQAIQNELNNRER